MQCFHTFANFFKMLPQPFHMSCRSICAIFASTHTSETMHTTSQGSCRDWGTMERHKETDHDLEMTGQGPEHLLHTQNTSTNLQSAYSYGPLCWICRSISLPAFKQLQLTLSATVFIATATSSSSTAKLIPYFQ